jgi:hypothetical protein
MRRNAVSVTNVFVTQFQRSAGIVIKGKETPLNYKLCVQLQPSREHRRASAWSGLARKKGYRMKNRRNLVSPNLVYKQPTCMGKNGLGRNGKPLTSYHTRDAANDAARSEEDKFVYKMMTPYRCPRCQQFHTQPVECGCTDSEGESKLIYKTPEDAEKAKAYLEGKKPWLRLYVIQCKERKGWHLTSKKVANVEQNKRAHKPWWRCERAVAMYVLGF